MHLLLREIIICLSLKQTIYFCVFAVLRRWVVYLIMCKDLFYQTFVVQFEKSQRIDSFCVLRVFCSSLEFSHNFSELK